ncbi:DUF742 domain-containing protein [Actinocorallia sp. A-T 12471]|uniref:DUF742 domain-containing protein n=1 Tax=Actinocorallia sp. A-T 12471 TaxID=3089813 RepID=UPI0029D0173F|nr:DUF742 domain-containing protein [Actinocorallia sp. A-T 12471]MDX6742796.1 DUF742 domain-containing protein [Actinocorallia sp. A-T 12471]
MTPRRLDAEDPDRFYTVTGGRTDAGDTGLDIVTLVITESAPTPGMQSEHAQILRLAEAPVAVVELSAELKLPISVVKILLIDLIDTGRLSVRGPAARRRSELPDMETLKQVLLGLQSL